MRKFWWTRTQRIRTMCALPLDVTLADAQATPLYQRLTFKVFQLRQLGLNREAMAKSLGVTGKTVAKAIVFLDRANEPI